MAVFGEETFKLPIFNGLGITDRPTVDLCPQLTNLFMSAEEEYRLREDLVTIQALTKANVAIPVTSGTPRSIMETTLEIFTAVGSETVDSPSLLAFYANGAAAGDCTWLNTNVTTPLGNSVVQVVPATYGVKAFCQYKDRYYGSNGLTAGKIYRISGFAVGGPALTMTDVLATNGVDILLTFKSRVFGIKKGRIYYTDLPAIGGYPETWNAALNFVDIPSVDYDVTVHNAIIYKDKIYMFTDKGIYVFTASGAPENWSIQLVSSNYPVYDRDSVCINKNLIFMTDQQSVTMFDGSEFKNVGVNVRAVFHNFTTTYAWFSVYPFEDGVILCRNTFTNSAGNYAGSATNAGKKVLYYNMTAWAEIEWKDNAWAVLKAGKNLLPYRGKTASSWIYMLTGAPVQLCFFYDSGLWKGDTTTTDYAAGFRWRKPVALESPSPFLKSRSHKRFKFIEVYGYLNDVNPGGSILAMNGEPVTSTSDGQSIFKVPADSVYGSSFKAITAAPLLIAGEIDISLSGANFPPFLLIGAECIYNQDNRDRDGAGL